MEKGPKPKPQYNKNYMKIENIEVKKLKLATYNPRRISDKELKKLVTSIEEHGFIQPVLINKNYTIIGGHQRVKAAKQLNLDTVPCVIIDVSKDKEKEINLALNRISGDWEETALKDLLEELEKAGRLYATGFESRELERLQFKQGNKLNRKLIQDFIVPPFSIFDTKQGYWTNRKKEWLEQLGRDGEGRSTALLDRGGLEKLAGKNSESNLSSTSNFDPVLAEVIYTWYADKGATIIDPFSGGITRGGVAAALGYKYIGTDLNGPQVESNKEAATARGLTGAEWHIDDGFNLGKHTTAAGPAELLFTCPPYYDLEKYTDSPEDLSNKKTYKEFLKRYSDILARTYPLLKKNAWAIIVVGNVRDKEGNYHNLVGDTVTAMEAAGFKFYNEIILATAIATATLRARRTMESTKKVTKIHQNILFFSKGKEVKINKTLKEILLTGQTATAHHDVLVFKK